MITVTLDTDIGTDVDDLPALAVILGSPELGSGTDYEPTSSRPRYSAPVSGADTATLGTMGMKLK
jgi:hypothetical protein